MWNYFDVALVVYTRHPDTYVTVPGGMRVLLRVVTPDGIKPVIVDEDTVVWAEAVEGGWRSSRMSLRADPETRYYSGVRAECPGGAVWSKEFH